MQQSNLAQQQPSKKPALAPNASQITPQAQGQAMILIPTLKHPRNQHEDTNAARLTDRNEGIANIIHI